MIKSTTPKVSIIVPIYNVEQYIHKCIQSIIGQTYDNIEILLVDDESPDKCPMICDKYALQDNRVVVIHKRNGGLSDARNAGVQKATGEYVAFVDGDDYIHPDFIKSLSDNAIQQDADISVCSYSKVYDDTKEVVTPKMISSTTFSNIEGMRDIFSTSSLCEVMTWNKLYKKELFDKNKILFPKGKIHEDNFTTYKLFYEANRIAFRDQPFYCYLQRQTGSIMSEGFSDKSLSMAEASTEAIEFIKNKEIPLLDEVNAYDFSIHISLINKMFDVGKYNPQTRKKLIESIKSKQNAYIRNPHIKLQQKIAIFVIRNFTFLYEGLRKSYRTVKG